MEDYALDIIIGKGPSARSLRLDLPKFTLIGATTKAGSLTGPLRDRFGVINRLEIYTDCELSQIVKRSAKILNIDIVDSGAMQIAMRSRGTPRIANRLLKRVRDFAQIKGTGVIDEQIANIALEKLEIDDMGLDKIDKDMMLAIINNFDGGPVGLDTLAAMIGEDTSTIEDVYEPFLLQRGFLQRTPRGRIATSQAYSYFEIEKAKD